MATVKKMRYQQLTDYLKSKLPQSYRRSLYSWMENGRLIDQGGQCTATGIEILHVRYDAVLFFDEFPYHEISAHYVMALIQLWLNENDPLRQVLDLSETPFDLDIVDDKTADLQFTVTFQEPLTAVDDPKGALLVDGNRYRLDEIEIDYATDVDVIVTVTEKG